MDMGPEPTYSDIIAGRVNAVGQQNNKDRLLRINPERSAGIPQMSHTGFGKKMTATGAIRWRHVEPQRPPRWRLPGPKIPNQVWVKKWLTGLSPVVRQQKRNQSCDIGGCPKKPGMAINTARDKSIVIVNLSLEQGVSPGTKLGGRDIVMACLLIQVNEKKAFQSQRMI